MARRTSPAATDLQGRLLFLRGRCFDGIAEAPAFRDLRATLVASWEAAVASLGEPGADRWLVERLEAVARSDQGSEPLARYLEKLDDALRGVSLVHHGHPVAWGRVFLHHAVNPHAPDPHAPDPLASNHRRPTEPRAVPAVSRTLVLVASSRAMRVGIEEAPPEIVLEGTEAFRVYREAAHAKLDEALDQIEAGLFTLRPTRMYRGEENAVGEKLGNDAERLGLVLSARLPLPADAAERRRLERMADRLGIDRPRRRP